MGEWRRREFMGCALTAAGMPLLQAESPLHKLAIARGKSSPADARRLTRAAVAALGGMTRFVSRGQNVFIKPNISWDRRPEQAACTNPDVVASLVEMCFEAGAAKVVVSDNPCVTAEKSFARSGIREAAERAGARCYPMDERRFRRMAIRDARVVKQWEIYPEAIEAGCLINVAIVKQHSLCRAALGMKNLMGVCGGARNRFHQDIGGAVADIAGFVRPRLVVLDAVRVLTANGPTGGNLADVKRQDTVAAGVDQVAIDAFGATLLGIRPADVAYVAEGHARGLGTMDFQSLSPARVEV